MLWDISAIGFFYRRARMKSFMTCDKCGKAMNKAADPFNSVTGRRTFDQIRDAMAVRFGLLGESKGEGQ
jgi:hypothetical protein